MENDNVNGEKKPQGAYDIIKDDFEKTLVELRSKGITDDQIATFFITNCPHFAAKYNVPKDIFLKMMSHIYDKATEEMN